MRREPERRSACLQWLARLQPKRKDSITPIGQLRLRIAAEMKTWWLPLCVRMRRAEPDRRSRNESWWNQRALERNFYTRGFTPFNTAELVSDGARAHSRFHEPLGSRSYRTCTTRIRP